jgi:hypothetical protein
MSKNSTPSKYPPLQFAIAQASAKLLTKQNKEEGKAAPVPVKSTTSTITPVTSTELSETELPETEFPSIKLSGDLV